jgi:hypothetical protein
MGICRVDSAVIHLSAEGDLLFKQQRRSECGLTGEFVRNCAEADPLDVTSVRRAGLRMQRVSDDGVQTGAAAVGGELRERDELAFDKADEVQPHHRGSTARALRRARLDRVDDARGNRRRLVRKQEQTEHQAVGLHDAVRVLRKLRIARDATPEFLEVSGFD